MSKKLTATKRHKRELRVPAPDRKGNIKIPYEGWIECAKVILIEEGIGAVKIDRLAKRLKVTRGGFYYHFKSHHALLEALLEHWRTRNRFVPEVFEVSSPAEAYRTLESLTDAILHEKGFDPQFDMAVREWARISAPVGAIVKDVDDVRIKALRKLMTGLGCGPREAEIRARVFYYHQIGYYALGIEEDARQREQNAPVYLLVLCGESYLKAARASGERGAGGAQALLAA